jgi:hypothetical protein
MKYKAAVIFLSAVLVFVLGGCSREKMEHVYVMNKICDTEPRLSITKITVTNKNTKVDFKYVYKIIRILTPGTNEALSVTPPGQTGALSIVSADGGKKYKLLKVDGIPTMPDYALLKTGSVVEFILTFERIDDFLKKFDIVEGDAGMTIPWKFLNIQLP